jgi:hypothetical protein
MPAFFASALVIPALWHPLQQLDKIASLHPNVIVTVDPVAAQAHGSVVVRSAEAKIARLRWRVGRGLEKESLWSELDCASS